MSFSQVTLKEHSLDKLASCISALILGKRRTGKSTLASHIVSKLSQAGIKRFAVFCGNRENIIEWQRVVHPLFVHGKDIDALERIVRWQEDHVGADREAFEEREKVKQQDNPKYVCAEYSVPLHLQVCVVIDDMGNDRAVMHSKLFKDIQSNGRHYGMSVLFLLQYITQLHPENRDQADYIAMLQTTNTKSVDKVFAEYVTSTCCSRQRFAHLLAACTSKRGKCMFIDNNGSMQLESRIFFAKIPHPVPRILVGSKKFIKYGKDHYLSTRRQTSANNSAGLSKQPSTEGISALSHKLDDDDEPPEDDDDDEQQSGFQGHSVVSLNRRRHLNLSAIREGRETFQDSRGNMIQVQLKNSKGNKDD